MLGSQKGLTDMSRKCYSLEEPSVSKRLEKIGCRKVEGKQLERIISAAKAGQDAALEAMKRRETRTNDRDQAERSDSLN
jgi:hypothetical protein